jgi:nucleotide-binding universal stress UspA family protein
MSIRRILLAYDGTPEAIDALATAAELASALGAAIGVVSVVPVSESVGFPPQDGDEEHTKELLQARERLSGLGLSAELHRASGDPAIEIEAVATEHGYDTVVVGCRGLSTIGRLLHGSVSEHVATHARATVVVVRRGLHQEG